MRPITLESFIESALRERRIRFGDVRRLERDVLPDGLRSQGEAEALLALDRAVASADPAWTTFLMEAIRGLLRAAPGDGGNGETAKWLASALGPRPTRTGGAIARELLGEGGTAALPRQAVAVPTNADGARLPEMAAP